MIGIGIDLVEISKFKGLVDSIDFMNRCFCFSEIEQYKKCKRITFLAGRFAAKEATLKALGTGLIDGLSLTDIEIIELKSGAPKVQLSNKVLAIAIELGIKTLLVSISHTDKYATAIIVAK